MHADERDGARRREAPARERHDELRMTSRWMNRERQAGKRVPREEAGEGMKQGGAVQRAVTFNGDIASSEGERVENTASGS
jgi:hypothetical protein